MKVLARVSAVFACLCLSPVTIVLANPISPAEDGTGTQVTSASNNPNQFNINGGTRSRANLFHSFDKFGLNKGQIANFQSNPSIRNILGRVVGGDASRINGLIQVVGGRSNLFLMNPSGFIFGPNATLNVPGSFTATTANGIQIGDYWFDALGKNNYANLVGEPNGFAFVKDQSGAIVNAGKLSVPQGEQITLAGGLVINTGTLEAPAGKVTILSVPDQKLVKINQEGSLLSLGLPTSASSVLSPGLQGFTPLALPTLLTGGEQPIATGVIADRNGVRLTGNNVLQPTDPGTTLLAGTVDVSGRNGGTVHVLGDQVGLLGANINASGDYSGGTVLAGGEYRGQGVVPNATRTLIDNRSVITADALKRGTGGRVIAWADDATAFYGDISVRGGVDSGDGGFVEVSGYKTLDFQGQVDASAPNGNFGTLLLDPRNIEIVEASAADPITLAGLSSQTEDVKFNKVFIENASAGANVKLEASNNIIFSAPLNLTKSITLTATAGNEIIVNAPIRGESFFDELKNPTNGAEVDLLFSANSHISINSSLHNLRSLILESDSGDIKINGGDIVDNGGLPFRESIQAFDAIRIVSKKGNITIGENNKTLNVFVGFNRQQFLRDTREKKVIPTGGFVDRQALAEIIAPEGDIKLYGAITISRGSTLKIAGQSFQGLQPIIEKIITLDASGNEETSSTQPYNLGIAYEDKDRRGGDRELLEVLTEEPNVLFTVRYLDKNLTQPDPKESNDNISVDTKIDILLRDGTSFVIGQSFNAASSNSGLSEPLQSLKINNGDGASIAGQSSFGNGDFNAGLLEPEVPSESERSTVDIASSESEFVVESDGDFNITPIQGTNFVRAQRAGELLSFLVENPNDKNGNPVPITPDLLPELLTGDGEEANLDIDDQISWDWPSDVVPPSPSLKGKQFSSLPNDQ